MARAELLNFVELLTRSGLLRRQELRDILKSLSPDERPTTAAALGRLLVARGHLTPYQSSHLLSGNRLPLVLHNLVILDKLGQGGMGEVYLAEQRRMKRRVAVKILPEWAVRNENLLQRFYREVEAAARLVHPNIVTAYDAGEYQGVHYLVMEYVDGVDLGTMVDRSGPLPIDFVVSCIIQAARGLQFAHQRGVIHRDIKPSNLLVDRSHVVKILDMGLARLVDTSGTGEARGELTTSGHIVGTVDYMSPEQLDNSSRVDHRTDIYSLGCTMFRLLTGQPPFRRPSLLETLLAHKSAPIPRVSSFRSEVPPELDVLLASMLAKNPEERFASMADVIAGLEELGDHGDFRVAVPDPFASGVSVQDGATQRDTDASTKVQVAAPNVVATLVRPGSSSHSDLKTAVGIDLGTTYSSIAYVDAQGVPTTISNAEGELSTPSMVYWDGDEVVVGQEAIKALVTDQDAVAAFPKRDLGLPQYHRLIAGVAYPPEVLEAQIIYKLVRDAAQKIGPIRQAVVTVPAYFDEVRRKATQDAGYIAGIEVLDILNEPTAAALAYGYHEGLLDRHDQAVRRVLIFDLGGGTFDVTVMQISQGEFRTLATDGDMQLGGLDWDRRLLEYVADRFVEEYGVDPRRNRIAAAHLWRLCDEAKRSLSTRRRVTLVVPFAGRQSSVAIDRELFEELTADLLDRTALTARQTLEAAGLSWSQLDDVLMVGGMTRVPAVARMLQTLSGRQPRTVGSPEEAVAMGAAIYARFLVARRRGLQMPFRLVNVNSHSLGIVAMDSQSGRRCNAILIPRNSALPAVAKRVFLTKKDGQQSIAMHIVEGESTNPDECSVVGRCVVRNLPPDLPRHSAIEVAFQYAENGRLTVAVQLPGHSEPLECPVSRENLLSGEQLDYWQRIVTRQPAVA